MKCTYIEHLADIAILSGALRKLNCTSTWRIVSDESKRIETGRIGVASVRFVFALGANCGSAGGGCRSESCGGSSEETVGFGGGGEGRGWIRRRYAERLREQRPGHWLWLCDRFAAENPPTVLTDFFIFYIKKREVYIYIYVCVLYLYIPNLDFSFMY